MGVTLAEALRGGSGLLMIGLGVFLLALRPRMRGAKSDLAVFLVGFGSSVASANLSPDGWLDIALVLASVALVVASYALLAFGWRTLPREPWILGVGLGVGIAAVAPALVVHAIAPDGWSLVGSPAGPLPRSLYRLTLAVGLAAVLAFVAAAARALPSLPPEGRRRAVIVTAAVGPIVGARAALDVFEALPYAAVAYAPMLLAVAVSAALWAVAAFGPNVRVARNVSLWLVAVPLAVFALVAGLGSGPAEATGVAGIARTLGVAVLAYGVTVGILGADLPTATVRRGSLATLALVVLLVVAQVAQNFLSDAYGLLTGGIVAGALLFAAQPIQRAVDRLGATASATVVPAPPTQALAPAYREAVRFALKDRRVTRTEELHLARLAQQMGLGAEDAMRLRHEVEDELGITRS